VTIEEKLEMSRLLIGELDKLIEGLNPHDDEFDEIYSRALHLKMKMKLFYAQFESPELLEQLTLMDSIIKKIEEIHNRRGMY
jgi:prephenate dehydratase